MNIESKNFRSCTEKILLLEDYKNTFVSAEAGLDMIRSDTLLIIMDANNFNILESPDIANNVADFIVIDHHRKVAEFEHEPLLALIDPSASSASEIITGILEQCIPGESIYKEEANLLLSGIMVDTKNFTRTTGTKTFSAAMYLRGIGANSEIANTFFHEDFEDFLSEAKFSSNVTIYLDRIAITESDGNDPKFDRIAAAKAADKLLSVRGVDASFALVSINDKIHISARSNGGINVQLILEKMGGGGHFDSAAAAVSGRDMKQALYRLKDAIDEYFAEA
jgi:c-di-AMP phosphodiesterase-like protein